MESNEKYMRREQWDDLAREIEQLDPPRYGGIGETVTESIVKALRRGDIAHAKACCFNESDKFGSREKIKRLLIKNLFDGKNHPWGITDPWKDTEKE